MNCLFVLFSQMCLLNRLPCQPQSVSLFVNSLSVHFQSFSLGPSLCQGSLIHMVCRGRLSCLLQPGGLLLRLLRSGGLLLRLLRPGGLLLCLLHPGGLLLRLLRPGLLLCWLRPGFLLCQLCPGLRLRPGFLLCRLRPGSLLCLGALPCQLCLSSWPLHFHVDLALRPSPCSTSAPPPSWIVLSWDHLEAAPWGGGGSVMNPVRALLFAHHQRSPAHHIDSHTTQTITCHTGLQFPSLIALIAHTQLNALITHTQLNPIRHSL